jgi:hypothetical protein
MKNAAGKWDLVKREPRQACSVATQNNGLHGASQSGTFIAQVRVFDGPAGPQLGKDAVSTELTMP